MGMGEENKNGGGEIERTEKEGEYRVNILEATKQRFIDLQIQSPFVPTSLRTERVFQHNPS